MTALPDIVAAGPDAVAMQEGTPVAEAESHGGALD